LINYRQVAEATGLDVEKMLAAVGLPADVLSTPDTRIPANCAVDLLEISAKYSRVQSFGLQMSEGRALSAWGPLSILMRCQRTVGDVFFGLIDHIRTLNEALTIDVVEDVAGAVIKVDVVASIGLPKRQAVELTMGAIVGVIREFLGKDWKPRNVSFVHSRPSDLCCHRRILGDAIKFDAESNGIFCTKEDFNKESPAADVGMARYAEQLLISSGELGKPSILNEVRRVAASLLPRGRCDIDAVAEQLGVVRRTLQRHLAEYGLSFSSIVNDVRSSLAKTYISESKRSITEVSALLGFSALSGFSRWYKKNFGCSPKRAQRMGI
jgi:AraC-like DNA-binding protein